MGKRKPTTPRSRVKNALRQVWLRSRERAGALKLAHYTCKDCGKKQSTAKGKELKVQVHHRNGIDWDGLVDLVFERLLQTPEDYDVLCEACHLNRHAIDQEGR